MRERADERAHEMRRTANEMAHATRETANERATEVAGCGSPFLSLTAPMAAAKHLLRVVTGADGGGQPMK